MKKVMIIGASSGIGLAISELFISLGYRVGLGARRTERFAAMQRQYPGQVEYGSIDINSPKAVDDMLDLNDRLGGMDIYFHVAGIGYDNPERDPERDVAIATTNACGFARLVCAAYNWFRTSGHPGRIAAITSVAGTNGIGPYAAYCASKAFDQTYLRAMEQLARQQGAEVRFTDIRPGWIYTPLLHDGVRYPMAMPLDYAAQRIVRAVIKGRRVAVIDRKWNILVGLWRLMPNWLWVRFPHVM